MKNLESQLLLTFALVSLVSGCKSKLTSKTNITNEAITEPSSRGSVEVDFKSEKFFKSPEGRTLAQEFHQAESELSKAGGNLLLFAKCGDPEGKGPERIERVKNPESWPDDRLEMYVFLLGPSNRIRLMQVVPNSESGDWFEQNDYLFAPNGALQYWEKYYGSFNPDEPSKAWYAFAWSQGGAVVDQASKFVDSDGHSWKGTKPQRPPLPPLQLKTLVDQYKLNGLLREAKVELVP